MSRAAIKLTGASTPALKDELLVWVIHLHADEAFESAI